MTDYINPKGMTKEQWLKENAARVPEPTEVVHNLDSVLVCLVNNGGFSAAAICDSARDLEAFTDRTDTRMKEWFVANKQEALGQT